MTDKPSKPPKREVRETMTLSESEDIKDFIRTEMKDFMRMELKDFMRTELDERDARFDAKLDKHEVNTQKKLTDMRDALCDMKMTMSSNYTHQIWWGLAIATSVIIAVVASVAIAVLFGR